MTMAGGSARSLLGRAARALSTWAPPRTFRLPHPLPLQRGGVLEDASIVYRVYGDPSKPCILHPTSFDAQHPDLEYAIGCCLFINIKMNNYFCILL